ncbi:histone H2A.1 [Pyrus ussuriensis x Pyrus communis]|uniref:Histone H2A.1 n=1 Tax=Pyrus ussuriensis x Pyrus communis TaxID=2448454 RepID=A0A5N5G729_9ROSA|nr:histone H2A.1 [Pyrus ussuriensis x Pyrus communis]
MEATKATKGAGGRKGERGRSRCPSQLKPISNSPSAVSLVSSKRDATPNVPVPASNSPSVVSLVSPSPVSLVSFNSPYASSSHFIATPLRFRVVLEICPPIARWNASMNGQHVAGQRIVYSVDEGCIVPLPPIIHQSLVLQLKEDL